MSVTKLNGVLDQSGQLLQTALRSGPTAHDGTGEAEAQRALLSVLTGKE